MQTFDTTIYIPWYFDNGATREMALLCIGYFEDDEIFVTCVPDNFSNDDKAIKHEVGFDKYKKDVFDLLNDDIQNEIYHQLEEYRDYLKAHPGSDAMDATREEAYEIRTQHDND